jgi:hypothetical protein
MNAATQVSTPVSHGVGWLVPSTSGADTYDVEVTEHTMRSTCPRWVYRGAPVKRYCKHSRRVLAMKQEVTMA